MSGSVYEIRLSGRPAPEVVAGLGAVRCAEEPAETVLLLTDLDADGLQQVIARLEDLGLELREIRQLTVEGGQE
jgi:hypothetical protein